jgi:ArsR family transcriptional regulator
LSFLDLFMEGPRPSRLEVIVTFLAVLELTRILGQSQPRVSRHLKLLVAGGLLERFREAQFTRFRLVTASTLSFPAGTSGSMVA